VEVTAACGVTVSEGVGGTDGDPVAEGEADGPGVRVTVREAESVGNGVCVAAGEADPDGNGVCVDGADGGSSSSIVPNPGGGGTYSGIEGRSRGSATNE
jgi:hypothetical protein